MTDKERPSTSNSPSPLRLSRKPPPAPYPRGQLKPGQIALLVCALLLAALLVVTVAVFKFLENPFLDYACSGPGQRALAGREDFVRAHFSDASAFEVATYDCEDGGSAHLAFKTSLKPAAARGALLDDPACLPYRPSGDDRPGVLCRTGSGSSLVFFDTASGDTTTGELHLSS